MENVQIGIIVNAAGLKGEVKLFSYSAPQKRYEELGRVFVDGEEHKIEKVRYVKNAVVLKLSGINDRDAAEGAKGKGVFIKASDLPVLSEGTFYIRDMIGLLVFDDTGGFIGKLSDVVQNSAQDLYEIETECGKKALIPAVEEFILNIDILNKRMDVKLIEGLI